MSIERDEIDAVGRRIQSLLLDGENALLISIGAKAGDADCELQSCIVTVRGNVGAEIVETSGNAVGLYDAACIARGKLRIARENHAEKFAKQKGGRMTHESTGSAGGDQPTSGVVAQ